MKEIKKGYKDTEIGIIPEDWQIKNIANSCSIKARIGWQGLTKSEYQKFGEFILITGTDFKNGTIFWESCSFVSKYRYEQDRNIQVEIGDVLITKDGTIGKIAFVKELPYPSTLNSGVFVVRPLDKDINKTFLSLVFKSKYFDDFLDKLIAGSTINHLYQKDFASFNFPAPKPEEQQAIAEALSDMDAFINALNKQIEKKKNIKQGAMQELLSGKKRLQGFTGEWEEKYLGEIARIQRGGSPRPITSYVTNDKEGINWIKIGDNEVSEKYITQTKEKIKPEGVQYSRFVHKGDLLLSNSMSYGRPYILDIDGCIHDGWLVLQDYDIVVDFLYYILGFKTTLQQYKSLAAGSSVLNLNKEIVNKVILYYPPTKEEQTAIAQILTDMDNEIEELEKKRDKYLNIKSGMMQQLLTGKIRLINAADCSKLPEEKKEETPANGKKKHSKQFDEAVIISFLVDKFGSKTEPLSRFMYTKLSYFIHRKHDCAVIDYEKFAAGPYNPKSRYGGPEKIGKENEYFDLIKDAKGYDAFAPQHNIQEAVDYFTQWYGRDIQKWIEQFRQYKPWDLETLATVDMAINDLGEKGIEATVINIKKYLSSIPKWKAKLDKSHFSDTHIQNAINESIRLFKI